MFNDNWPIQGLSLTVERYEIEWFLCPYWTWTMLTVTISSTTSSTHFSFSLPLSETSIWTYHSRLRVINSWSSHLSPFTRFSNHSCVKYFLLCLTRYSVLPKDLLRKYSCNLGAVHKNGRALLRVEYPHQLKGYSCNFFGSFFNLSFTDRNFISNYFTSLKRYFLVGISYS